MAEPKFKQYYRLMMEKNAALFAAFQPIHDGYAENQTEFEQEFHTKGLQILDVIRDWERRLCYGTEKGQYASYSAKLSEKFWEEVKKELPLIEQVGVKKTVRKV